MHLPTRILWCLLLTGIVGACAGCGEPDREPDRDPATQSAAAGPSAAGARPDTAPGATGSATHSGDPPDPRSAHDDQTTMPPADRDAADPQATATPTLATATLGAGCFWCIEAVLERLDGVTDVVSGYMGGALENPTYDDVCSGATGHAEVVQVTFDPQVISFAQLLDVFFQAHDPTTLNRQGPDRGTQYRSAIFVHDDAQRATAERCKATAQGHHQDPIVTEITAAARFWPAEKYHQDFFARNPNHGYCNAWIPPKLRKLGLDDK